jgi:actin-related protein
MGDDVQALVVDNGSGMCKAGFAGMSFVIESSCLAMR